jgi:hypothetical protein
LVGSVVVGKRQLVQRPGSKVRGGLGAGKIIEQLVSFLESRCLGPGCRVTGQPNFNSSSIGGIEFAVEIRYQLRFKRVGERLVAVRE